MRIGKRASRTTPVGEGRVKSSALLPFRKRRSGNHRDGTRQLCVAACRQIERPAQRIEFLQLAGLWLDGLLKPIRDDVAFRDLARRFPVLRLANGGFATVRLGGAFRKRHGRRSRCRFNRNWIEPGQLGNDRRQLGDSRRGRNVSARRGLRIRDRWLNCPRYDDASDLWTANGRGIGHTEIAKREFE